MTPPGEDGFFDLDALLDGNVLNIEHFFQEFVTGQIRQCAKNDKLRYRIVQVVKEAAEKGII